MVGKSYGRVCAGVGIPNGKALGVLPWDFDGDGWPDLFVANDTVPNWLFHNNRNGTFSEIGVETGVAYASTGKARAGMGIDTADYENSGREALLIGNNSTEGLGLYQQDLSPSPSPGRGGAGGEVPSHFLDVAEENP